MENSTSSDTDFRSDIGPFSIVPEWLLDLEISHGAVRLYAVLARYTNSGQTAWPSRATLARRLHASKDTVDRYIKELVCVQALSVEHRKETTKDGNLLNRSNLYTLRVVSPKVVAPVRPPSRNHAPTGGLKNAPQNYNQLEPKPKNDLFDHFWIAYDKKVGKKKAQQQWVAHVKDEATANLAIQKATQQAVSVERQFRKDPERWIRDHRWEDDDQPAPNSLPSTITKLQQRVEREGL